MVYRGKPSKGCAICRKRRIRCDVRPDGCMNCERHRVQCPGYRDRLDLLFHHETEGVLSKHANNRLPPNEESQLSRIEVANRKQGSSSTMGAPSKQFTFSPDEFALSYCYRWHILTPESSSNNKLIIHNSTLLAAMKALGMATLSQKEDTPEIRELCRGYYVDALHALGSALASRDTALQDSALISVMMLSTYESIIGKNLRAFKTWLRHIEGAVSLVELRGDDQLETARGRLLFHQALMNIIPNCGRLSLRIPASITRLAEKLVDHVDDPGNFYWKMMLLRMQLIDLRSDVRNNRVEYPNAALNQAKEIDRKLQEGLAIHIAARPDRHSRDDGIIQPARFWIADRIRMSVIICRIDAQAVMLELLERNEASNTASNCDIGQGLKTISRLSSDFLESLPEGLVEQTMIKDDSTSNLEERKSPSSAAIIPPDLPPGYQSVANTAPQDCPVLHTIRYTGLIWQMGMVGRVNPPGGEIRKTAIKYIRTLGKALAMSQAEGIASYLEKDSVTRVSNMSRG